jgi:hypothetical protein
MTTKKRRKSAVVASLGNSRIVRTLRRRDGVS